jgi:hypothetical protein
MTTVAADVRRVGESSAPPGADALERDLRFARRLAWLLDAQFSFGRFRFGLDALIGLIPVVGDGAAALIGLYFVHLARKYRLGGWVMTGMVAVILIDFLIGSIPWLGDLFDAAYKPHLRNLRIFERAIARRARATSPLGS